ncbi:MarR family winged helix-turn-helix transcriptional regulator [Ruegeria sp. WL0004]|uniref:MarR family winged helix-turn-helix transcriptional regulator n=1 Tax=Ruegeria marisflavi TaxID=2984152 RepID=A0ABT2WNF3_9RHOB|nr:MarR family winged helix-turn-helix transcriptional regulator [Ruegeria sp. WL0004]MCU9836757.1 MarR family winged helix-turn-helix transcriptional regulator [Ruegeria sp. WL0004]
MSRPTPDPFAVWLPLARAHKAILTHVEAALKSAGLPGLDRYDILWELEQAGPDGLRPFELQGRLLLPQYGVSRLVDRLARAGHLTRSACDGDGRGQVLVLTPEGARVRAAMWAVYAAAMHEAIGDHLAPGEARRLAELLSKLTRPSDASEPHQDTGQTGQSAP